MSDKVKTIKDGPLPVEDTAMAMPPDDMAFLVECLKNPIGGGVVSIDTRAVAEARGYKNAGSVANRIAKMKKRYNLPITSGNRKGDSSPAGDIKVPVTPTKNKVVKARNTRGRAVKTPKKNHNSTGSGSGESSGDEDGMTKATPKIARKLAATTATVESGGEDDEVGFIEKGSKTSDAEEGEVSDDGAEGEEDDDLEKAQILKVEEDHPDEV